MSAAWRALVLGALLALGCGERTLEANRSVPGPTGEPARSSLPAAPTASATAAASVAVTEPPRAWAHRPARPGEPPRAIDLHVDTPWQVKFKGHDPGLSDGQATAQALRAGRYGAVVYPIYIADHLHKGHPTIADADEIYAAIDGIFAKRADLLWPAARGPTPDDEHVTAFVSIEGAGAFAEDITQIDRFIDRGVVLVGPVHRADNRLATSATGKDKRSGLSKLGVDFCVRVYERGALVDVSHMSDAAFGDLVPVAARFSAPIVATHSNARAIANHPRNLTDAQLRVIASTGGIAGVNFHHEYLNVAPPATLDDAVRQVRHMVAIAGVDHVAIGSDFDGATPPADLADVSYLPRFGEALRKAGMSESDVQKIFSENAKRVLAWTDARRRAKR